MSKKFAIVGAASSGKTVIFEKLKEEVAKNPKLANSTYFVPEAARDLIKLYKPSWPFSYQFQLKIQAEQLKREKQAYNTQSVLIICDRSVLDAVIYAQVMGFKAGSTFLFKRIKKWLPTYTKFFLLDIAGVPFKRENARRDAVKFREKVQQEFFNFLKNYNLPFEKIAGLEMERFKKILSAIKS